MSALLLTAIALLVPAALADGITTDRAIKLFGWVEENPLLDFIYRTNTPKPWQTLGIGFAIIAAEIFVAYELNKHLPYGKWIAPVSLIGQAAGHAVAAWHNSKAKIQK